MKRRISFEEFMSDIRTLWMVVGIIVMAFFSFISITCGLWWGMGLSVPFAFLVQGLAVRSEKKTVNLFLLGDKNGKIQD